MPFIFIGRFGVLSRMLNYIEYLKIPTNAAYVLVGIILAIQVIGELLEFKGKSVPEIMKIRKYFARRKKEKETLAELPAVMAEMKALLNSVEQHYNTDNITMRNNWMDWVNNQAVIYDTSIAELRDITLSLLIDNKRNTIIDFASYVANENSPVTREQFNRIFKIHKEYETIIEEHGLTNGEVNVAFRIITESYELHMKNHSFIEDVRGYDVHI